MNNDLAMWLLEQIAEVERRWTPKTVMLSGPRDIPNCIGPTGTGDCPEGWRLDHIDPLDYGSGPSSRPAWVNSAIREHELTHATPQQRWMLADCDAKRRIVEEYVSVTEQIGHAPPGQLPSLGGARNALADALRWLALVYVDGPGYREEWRPDTPE